jgi:hypothetical protein
MFVLLFSQKGSSIMNHQRILVPLIVTIVFVFFAVNISLAQDAFSTLGITETGVTLDYPGEWAEPLKLSEGIYVIAANEADYMLNEGEFPEDIVMVVTSSYSSEDEETDEDAEFIPDTSAAGGVIAALQKPGLAETDGFTRELLYFNSTTVVDSDEGSAEIGLRLVNEEQEFVFQVYAFSQNNQVMVLAIGGSADRETEIEELLEEAKESARYSTPSTEKITQNDDASSASISGKIEPWSEGDVFIGHSV